MGKLIKENKCLEDGISSKDFENVLEGKLGKDGGTMTGELVLEQGLKVNSRGTSAGLEMSGSTPYIDFHFGNSAKDYTSRIIEEAEGKLVIDAKSGIRFPYSRELITIDGGNILQWFVSTTDSNHVIQIGWSDENLMLMVDHSVLGYLNLTSMSDERLKSDVADVDENVLRAVGEVKLKQFRLKRNNPNEKISFGVMAQELIGVFEKYGLDVNDYDLVKRIVFEDGIEYYVVDYEQFCVLRMASLERGGE